MNCKHVEKHLDDYLKGKLDDVLSEMIRAHVETCPDCKSLLEREKSVSDFLNRDKKSTDLGGFSDDLLKKLKDMDDQSIEDLDDVVTAKPQPAKKWILLIFVILGISIIGLIVVPFESNLNQQQYIGSNGGPGFTWIGDLPLEEDDPFDLNNFGLKYDESDERDQQSESGDRVIHTLDFDDPQNLDTQEEKPEQNQDKDPEVEQ